MSNSEDLKQLQALAMIPLWEWPETVRELVRDGLSSDNAEIRAAAAEAAWGIMNQKLAPKLIGLVRDDPDPDVRARAAIALGPALEEYDLEVGYLGEEFDDEEIISEELFNEIQGLFRSIYSDTEQPPLVRRRVLEASVRAAQEWHAAAASAAHASGDRDWTMTALFCMGHLQGFEAEILDALHSQDADLLHEAVQAAGRACCDEAAPLVITMARDEDADYDLRLAAIDALANLDHEGVVECLDELTESDDPEIAETAEMALGDHGAILRGKTPDFDGEDDLDIH